jgi:hypothetical protein
LALRSSKNYRITEKPLLINLALCSTKSVILRRIPRSCQKLLLIIAAAYGTEVGNSQEDA